MKCVDPNTIVDILEGRVSEEVRAEFDAHVDECSQCRRLMAQLAAGSDVRKRTPKSPTNTDGSSEPTKHLKSQKSSPPQHGAAATVKEGASYESPPLFRAGAEIDHFRVMRVLGRGGMGEVYLARDTKLGRKVALKVVQPTLVDSKSALLRFQREARATAKLSHPNIVAIHAVGEHHDRPYVALEYVQGETLRERMDQHRLSIPESIRLAAAIADVLVHSHYQGVVHCDLKPSNVLIGIDGRVRVLDFGLATLVQPEAPASSVPVGSELDERSDGEPKPPVLTRGVGTPRYMSPEQWRQEPLTRAADVWALGIMLYELIADRIPFNKHSVAQLSTVVCGPDRVPPVDQFAAAPAEVVALLNQCLNKEPSERPTASEVLDELHATLPGGRTTVLEQENPFRGLMPFRERHAHLFFGREAEIAALVERVRLQPLLPVVGPSGVGKSSFVHAGVIPRLREKEPWVVIHLRPGAKPLWTLASRILRQDTSRSPDSISADSEPGSSGEVSMRTSAARDEIVRLAQRLQEAPRQLSLMLRWLCEQQRQKVLLYVDQLEELFTLTEDENVREAFLRAVFTAADDPSDPVRVIFTVRDDFLGRVAATAEARSALHDVTVLHSPEPEALEEILRRPVELLDHRYEDNRLVGDIIAPVSDEPAALTMVAFAAAALWERRDGKRKLLLRSAYEQIGGVEGALAKHADGVLAGFSAAELRLARQLMLRLVTADGTRKIVSQAVALEGLGTAGEHALGRLTKARLISVAKTRGDSEDDATLELAHESLVKTWRTLARWLEEGREEIAFVTELSEAAQLWNRRGCRVEELWTGEALHDAMRMQQRLATDLPGLAAKFLDRARRLEEQKLRRRRLLRIAAAGLSVAISVTAVLVSLFVIAQKEQAERQKERAEQREAEANEKRAEALQESARAAFAKGSVLEARAKLRMALEKQDSSAGRYLWWQLQNQPLLWKRRIGSYPNGLDWSPKAGLIALACGTNVCLFDVPTAQMQVIRGYPDSVIAVAFSPSGQQLAFAGRGGPVWLWNVQQGNRALVLKGHEGGVWALSFSPDGATLASGGDDQEIRLWDTRSGRENGRLVGHTARVLTCRYSHDGRTLASGGNDQTVRLWQIATRKQTLQLVGHNASVHAVDFNPNDQVLASGGLDRTVRLWHVRSGKALKELEGHTGRVISVAFSPDGRLLATAGYDQIIRLWDWQAGRQHPPLVGHHGSITKCVFSPDGRRLASVGNDRDVRVWKTPARVDPRRKQYGGAPVYRVRFNPDGRVVVSGGEDKRTRIWDVASGLQQRILKRHTDSVTAVDISPDGQRVATGSRDQSIRLWALASGRHQQALAGHTATVWNVRFSPDNRRLASASTDRTARVWNILSGGSTELSAKHPRAVQCAAFSPDGRQLATGSFDGRIRLWDATTGRLIRELVGHHQIVYDLKYSPNGQQLASVGSDGTLRLWDLATGQGQVRAHHNGRLHTVAFAPQADRIAAASSNNVALIWHLDSDKQVVLQGHTDEVNGVDFSHDGKLVATASDDGTVRLWETATAKPRWRGPVLLPSPPRLFSHRGWQRLDGTGAEKPPDAVAADKKWQRAVADNGRYGTSATDRDLMCLWTFDDRVELWNLRADKRLWSTAVHGLRQVIATNDGCAARSIDTTMVFARDGTVTKLPAAASATAMTWRHENLWVTRGKELVVFTPAGKRKAQYAVDTEITAILPVDEAVIVGHADGIVQRRRLDAQPTEKSFTFEGTPASAPLRLITGPQGTLLVGFANGVVGTWDQRTGAQLDQVTLHGRVTHLFIEKNHLYAATDLGDFLTRDLSVLNETYCDLMKGVWDEVPVVWRAGRLVLAPVRSSHRCR